MAYASRISQMMNAPLFIIICLLANTINANKKGDNAANDESSTSKETKDLEKEETSWQRPAVNYGGWNSNNKGSSGQGYGNNFISGSSGQGYGSNIIPSTFGGYGGHGNMGNQGWNSNYGTNKGWSNYQNINRPAYSGSNYGGNYPNYANQWQQSKGWNQGYGSGGSYNNYYGNQWPMDRNMGLSKGHSGGYGGSYGNGMYGNQHPVSAYWSANQGNQKGYPSGSRMWADNRNFGRYPVQGFGDYERRFSNYYQTRLPGNYKGSSILGRGDYDSYWPATRSYSMNDGYQRGGWK